MRVAVLFLKNNGFTLSQPKSDDLPAKRANHHFWALYLIVTRYLPNKEKSRNLAMQGF